MQKVYISALKIIAKSQDEGVTLEKLNKELQDKYENLLSFKSEDLFAMLQTNHNLQIDNSERVRIKATKEFSNSYSKRNLLALNFKEEDETAPESESIYQVYDQIVRAGKSGVKYNVLCDVLNKSRKDKKISTIMISNYCRRIEKLGYIKILPDLGCRIAVWRKYHAFSVSDMRSNPLQPSAAQSNVKAEQKAAEGEPDSDSESKLADIEPKKAQKKSHMTQDNILQALQNQTFILAGLPQRFNLAVNLQSYDAYKMGGFTMKELRNRLNIQEAKKTMERLLKNLNPNFNLTTTAYRDGKSFSHKYLIADEKLEAFYSKDPKEVLPKTLQKAAADGKSNANETNLPLQSSQVSVDPVLDYEVYTELLDMLEFEKKGSRILSEAEFKSFRDTAFESQNYKKKSEELIQRLVEDDEKQLPKSEVADNSESVTKSAFSKKALTRLKLNRIIFILNKIKSREIISSVDLKNYIVAEIESDSNWKIDRKTVRTLCEMFERFGLLKILDFEFNLAPTKQRKKGLAYRKTIIIHRSISEDDERIRKDPTLSNPTLRRDLDIPISIMDRGGFDKKLKKPAITRNSLRKPKKNISENLFIKKRKKKDEQSLAENNLELPKAELKGKAKKMSSLDQMKKQMEDVQMKFESKEGNVEEKIKRFDFKSCKMLAIEYKVMVFGAFFQNLFEKGDKKLLNFAFKCLINQIQRSAVDRFNANKVEPPKELYSFSKYSGLKLDLESEMMEEEEPLDTNEAQNLPLESFLNFFDKEAGAKTNHFTSVSAEINQIVKSSLGGSHNSGLNDKKALYLLGDSRPRIESRVNTKNFEPVFSSFTHLKNQKNAEIYERLDNGLKSIMTHICGREVSNYRTLFTEFSGRVDVPGIIYLLLVNGMVSVKKVVPVEDNPNVMETIDPKKFYEEVHKKDNIIYVFNS